MYFQTFLFKLCKYAKAKIHTRPKISNETRTSIPEAGSHDNGIVSVLLVVVVDLPHTQHSGVLLSLVRLVVFCLISES